MRPLSVPPAQYVPRFDVARQMILSGSGNLRYTWSYCCAEKKVPREVRRLVSSAAMVQSNGKSLGANSHLLVVVDVHHALVGLSGEKETASVAGVVDEGQGLQRGDILLE